MHLAEDSEFAPSRSGVYLCAAYLYEVRRSEAELRAGHRCLLVGTPLVGSGLLLHILGLGDPLGAVLHAAGTITFIVGALATLRGDAILRRAGGVR
jgi:hypothetical protein